MDPKTAEPLKNLHIVLIEPKNPGNIGATVRAMKNMGVPNLRLVNPVSYREVVEQKKMGYRSQEIIESSKTYPNLKEAVADISTVILATSKKGKWKRDFLSPETVAETVVARQKKEKVAIVFGREDSGVTIDESQLANYYVHIPSAVDYPSLNLSQAVMVILYEVYKRYLDGSRPAFFPKMSSRKNFVRLHENIWDLMSSLNMREDEYGLFYRSLKRALNRTHWTNGDIAVFDRMVKQVRWFIQDHHGIDLKEK